MRKNLSQPLASIARNAVFWVPSLYLAEGIPFNVVNGTAATMFKSLGVSDGQNTVALGQVVLVWSLKPFWAAFLDMYRTKKFFVLTMEIMLAVLFAGIAMSLPMPGFFQISIALLWIASFASATQDICADGIYLTAIDKKTQARLAGVQSMFWNLGRVLATGGLIWGGEKLANFQGWPIQKMWMMVWMTTAVVMGLLAFYHMKMLPTGRIEQRPQSAKHVVNDFLDTATTFFHKRAFWGMIAFVLFYRLGEGLILTEGSLFIQSATKLGGLGLTPGKVSSIVGGWGTVANISGGILGGLYLGKIGLRRALPLLALALNVPHFTYVYLSHYGAAGQGLPYSTITVLVCIQQFGYGFGFVGNMVYMMQQLAPGRATMTHYAFATALMNQMLVPTTMISGPLAEALGFSTFFLVVMFASVPSVIAAWKAPHPLGDAEANMVEAPDGTMHLVTVDDPDRLTQGEKTVQKLAGRASIFAMLNVLAIMVIDAVVLGWIRGLTPGSVWAQSAFGVLALNALLKVWLSFRTFGLARETAAEAALHGEKNYLGNAKGAKVATYICTFVSIAVLVLGAKLAF